MLTFMTWLIAPLSLYGIELTAALAKKECVAGTCHGELVSRHIRIHKPNIGCVCNTALHGCNETNAWVAEHCATLRYAYEILGL